MVSEGRRSGRRPREEGYVCPVCGQPVGTVIHRRKILGAFVPVWVPGPCRNPDCSAYEEPVEALHGSGARRPRGSHAEPVGPPATDSSTALGTRAAGMDEEGRTAGLVDMEGLDDQMGAAGSRHGGQGGPRGGRQQEPPRAGT